MRARLIGLRSAVWTMEACDPAGVFAETPPPRAIDLAGPVPNPDSTDNPDFGRIGAGGEFEFTRALLGPSSEEPFRQTRHGMFFTFVGAREAVNRRRTCGSWRKE